MDWISPLSTSYTIESLNDTPNIYNSKNFCMWKKKDVSDVWYVIFPSLTPTFRCNEPKFRVEVVDVRTYSVNAKHLVSTNGYFTYTNTLKE